MTPAEITSALSDATLRAPWHWYVRHAERYRAGIVTPFFLELSAALGMIDDRMSGVARAFIERIGSIGGRVRNQDDYDQLCQILAEIDVMQHTCRYSWPEGTEFEHEPCAAPGAPNPEVMICAPELTLGVEVKSPNIRRYRNDLPEGWQAVSRVLNPKEFEFAALPRDNAVKDALGGADEKFRSLRSAGRELVGILALVWDSMMHEPISAITNPVSGLFTQNTFDPDTRTFDHVDTVVIIPHLHQLIEGPGNRQFIDGTTFEWRAAHEFPFRPYIVNPVSARGSRGARAAEEVFGADDYRGLFGAEYSPADSILWIDMNN